MGLTHPGQWQLRDIVFILLPEVETRVDQMEVIGTVESVEAVRDIYSPVSGEVIDVNGNLEENPEHMNQDPYGKGWIARIKPSNLDKDLKNLMNNEQYAAYFF